MLTLLVLLPLVGIVLILLSNIISHDNIRSGTVVYNTPMLIGLMTSLVAFVVSVIMWLGFDNEVGGYQYLVEYSIADVGQYHFFLGVDGLNLFFVLLTTFITPIALLSNYGSYSINRKAVSVYVSAFLLLETLQLMTFVSLDLFMFYVFFESVLPVLFVIIIVYGTGNKVRSAYLLFLYTLLGSLFMLLAILTLYGYASTTDYLVLSLLDITLDSQLVLFAAFFLAFAVKTPLWPLAAWLYRAHADSPLAGSILLAGTILKLATYGFMRITLTMLPDASAYFGPFVQTIAIVSLIYASLSTVVQEDTKVLVAYSSIAHMAVVVLGLFSNTVIGIEGAIVLSIAHGFVSPALFACVGGVLYETYHTREIKAISGVATYLPVFSILFLLFTLANTAIPLSLNFVGEQLALIGTWESSPIIAVLGATGIVLSACYSVSFYNKLVFGAYTLHNRWQYSPTTVQALRVNNGMVSDVPVPLVDVTMTHGIFGGYNNRYGLILVTLLVPTVLLGIWPNAILDSLHMAVTQLVYII